jgi:universal stress protein A
MLKTILVPYDSSAHAEHALAWGLDLAEKWRAKVVLFHVVPPLSSFSYVDRLSALDMSKIEARLITEAEKHLQDTIAAQAGRTIALEGRARMGAPFLEICREAEQELIDLIVIGSHGRTGLTRALLGSVAEQVVRHAACPVLVVRLPPSDKKGP